METVTKLTRKADMQLVKVTDSCAFAISPKAIRDGRALELPVSEKLA